MSDQILQEKLASMGHQHGGQQTTYVAYSMVDSSRVSTFVISILLIVYGSFRSLNLEQENKEKSKEKEKEAYTNGTAQPGSPSAPEQEQNVQTIDSCQAMFLPIGASISLLIMFLFFDSLQMVFAVCTAILATVAFAFLLLPMCQYLCRPFVHNQKMSFGCCGRFTPPEIMAFCLSFLLVCIWVLTGHWLLMDALGMGLCVAFIALVRLPSLKVSTLLLVGLLVYDVFWVFFSSMIFSANVMVQVATRPADNPVFFSSYIFNTNVMVKVATRPAENPVGVLAKKLHLTGLVRDAPKLSLPGKLVFPSMQNSGHFSMLGLGDIVMPGLLLCFVLRYDAYRKTQFVIDSGLPPPATYYNRITYFHCSLLGYFLGLLTATVSSEVFKAAQPALLYLVPFTLLPLFTMAYLKGDLRRMWFEPFEATKPPKYVDV